MQNNNITPVLTDLTNNCTCYYLISTSNPHNYYLIHSENVRNFDEKSNLHYESLLLLHFFFFLF